MSTVLTKGSDRPRLKEQMQYCMDHPEEVSRLSKVQAQVSEVKGIMMENIDKVYYTSSSSSSNCNIIMLDGFASYNLIF